MAIGTSNSWQTGTNLVNNNALSGTASLDIGTPSGSDRLLVVMYAGETGSGQEVGDMTYVRMSTDTGNTTGLVTATAFYQAGRAAANDRCGVIAIWDEAKVASLESTTIYIHTDATANNRFDCRWRVFNGVDQTTPVFDSDANNSGGSSVDTQSATLTSMPSGSYVLAAGCHSTASQTPTWTGVTSVATYDEAVSCTAMLAEEASQSGNLTLDWDTNPTTSFAASLVAVALQETAGAPVFPYHSISEQRKGMKTLLTM